MKKREAMYRQDSGRRMASRPIRLLLLSTGLVVLAGIISACRGGADSRAPAGGGVVHETSSSHGAAGRHGSESAGSLHDHHVHAEPLGAPTDFSLYHLDAVWTDQNGEVRQLGSLGGRVQVVAMVYTSCGYACPRILADMKQIEAALAPEHRDGVGFVLVSIDPERDTPERLAAYAESIRLDLARWTLLTAPDLTVRELAALLGVKYRRVGEADYSHTNVITVLDQRGEIVHRQVGLGTPPAETVRVIEGLLGVGSR